MKKYFLLSVCITWTINLLAQEAHKQDSIKKYIANKSIAFTSEYGIIGNGITFDKIYPLSNKEKIAFSQSLLTSVAFPITQYGAIPFYGSTSLSFINGYLRATELGGYISYGIIIDGYTYPFADIGFLIAYRYQNPFGGLFLKTGLKLGALSAVALLYGLDDYYNEYSTFDAIMLPLIISPTISIGRTYKKKINTYPEGLYEKLSQQITDENENRALKREKFLSKKWVLTPHILIQNRDLFGQKAPQKFYSEMAYTQPSYVKDEAQSLYNIKNTTYYMSLSLTYKHKFNFGFNLGNNVMYADDAGNYRVYKNYRKERAVSTYISTFPLALMPPTNINNKRIIEPELGLGYTYAEVSVLNFNGGYDNGGNWPYAFKADFTSYQNFIQLLPSINIKAHYKLLVNIGVPVNLAAFTNGEVYRSHIIKTLIPNAIPADQYTYPKTEWNEDLSNFYTLRDFARNKILFHTLNLKIGYSF